MITQDPIEWDSHLKWFEGLSQKVSEVWFVYEHPSLGPCGVVNFKGLCQELGRAEWGFYMAPHAKVGMGSLMGREAIKYAFEVLDLKRLEANVLPSNVRSLHFHLKMGFRLVGFFDLSEALAQLAIISEGDESGRMVPFELLKSNNADDTALLSDAAPK
jgi:RimJ/RimL family protein N-acetyltransferase